jgi:hypothetical protein
VVANFRNRISMQQNEKSWHGVSEASAPFFLCGGGLGGVFLALPTKARRILCFDSL